MMVRTSEVNQSWWLFNTACTNAHR